jgi:hypothetical protein
MGAVAKKKRHFAEHYDKNGGSPVIRASLPLFFPGYETYGCSSPIHSNSQALDTPYVKGSELTTDASPHFDLKAVTAPVRYDAS